MSEGKKVGRPSKYKEEYCEQAVKLCKKGFINDEIAEFFGVNVDTIYEWQKKHPEFSDALKLGKKHSDSLVEDALYKKALGYDNEEVKEEIENGVVVKTTKTYKKAAGDTTAMIFWLKNRQPDRWREKTEQVVTLNDDFDSLLDDAADE